MFCSISGHVPEDPVVSSRSGQLYERRLAEKAIQENGKDPISGEDTSLEDLVSVKSNKGVKPRPSPATSIPGLLGLFQNEWDALMLESHTLRQSLSTVRQELSHALYQHDASCRVIARLMRERDEARSALQHARAAAPAGPVPMEMANGKRGPEEDVAGPAPAKKAKAGITPDIIEAMTACNAELSKGRKKRVTPAGTAAMDDIRSFSLLSAIPLHKTTQGGITAIDLAPDDETVVATAGMDATVQIYSTAESRVLTTLSGHTKRITDVMFLGTSSFMLTTSADKTARLWASESDGGAGPYTVGGVLTDHTGEITCASLHPTRKYFATASLDRTWAFYDVENALCYTQVTDDSVESGYTACQFHPDGLILGTGTQGSMVHIWEVRQQKNVAKFEGHKGPVSGLCFSENGYYLATTAADGVKLWDLRKLKNFRTLTPYEAGAVTFDHSGQYLAVGGGDARVYGSKQDWAALATFPDLPKKGVLSLKWGDRANRLYVGATDHNLRIYQTSQTAA
ncbi:hypothetical protein WJX84_007807 [Apatococcus fuscideae]|uniref:Pre-mRNA-processing factor 19 n=1 Tax=Apatococcus fuscideae TaxID=2026836 RepID=A0AAW1TBU2_9CHLO